jgi:hypothetical protein
MKGLARRLAALLISQILTFLPGVPSANAPVKVQVPHRRSHARPQITPVKFEQMKEALAPATAQSENEQKDKPSLLMPGKGCPELQKATTNPASPSTKSAPKAWWRLKLSPAMSRVFPPFLFLLSALDFGPLLINPS